MEERRHSPTSDAPEAVPNQPRSAFGFVGSDDYEYFEPPASAFERHRSPVPEYQQYDTTSSRVSAQSPPPPSSDIGRSPEISEGGFTKSRPLSPSVQYSEIHSPDPEAVYTGGEKEAVYSQPTPRSKVPSYYANPVPGIHHQNSGDRPQVWSNNDHQYQQPGQSQQEQPKKRPFYKRWWFWLIIVALVIIIAVAVACGVVFGTKKSNEHTTTPPGYTPPGDGTNGTSTNADPDTSVGGYLNSAFYSESGAWNGSGIAIASANTDADQSIYAFFQDSTGLLQYTLMDPSGQWNLVGPVNSGSYKALNGTPLSAVQHQLGAELVWHIFYIDDEYTIRERIITNTTTNGPSPVWTDGPLSQQNLKTWRSNTIGLQACYWGDYYGQWSYDTTQASAGIHLWYASGATEFSQYSWTNGTDEYNFDQVWKDLSGNGGVGCQTWDTGMTEYVWFVNTKNEIAMYWKDNNRTGLSSDAHPIGSWTPVNIDVQSVQKDSGLGYTNYMVWQAEDTTINGANVTWGAENTTIAENGQDVWTLQTNGEDVHAIRGTHLSITAVSTVSKGASLLTFFQEAGDDMKMYTRDAFNSGGLWQAAAEDPVVPS
ncbi:hypothetical protein PMZ80_003308 [Knufia obscura]|uniref:Fucose-specific lectin n=1 Tax=Knufia obscura TaxID=1635080 RepID=A0ABR0RTV0_9EURO|nr:hypothetical protein PMZ80_003308 [Knufia obscura]